MSDSIVDQQQIETLDPELAALQSSYASQLLDIPTDLHHHSQQATADAQLQNSLLLQAQHHQTTTSLNSTLGGTGNGVGTGDMGVEDVDGEGEDDVEGELEIGVPSTEGGGKVKVSTAVTKKHWQPEEDKKLLALVDESGPRNWSALAKQVGGGRTGPSCCARWCRLAGPKAGGPTVADSPAEPTLSSNEMAYQAISKGKRAKWSKWTPAEDADLLALVEEHGAKNWHFISSHMKTERSDDSCCGRWMHYLQPKSAGKGGAGVGKDEAEVEKPGDPVASTSAASPVLFEPGSPNAKQSKNPRWTPAEDAQLLALKLSMPNISWNTVADGMVPKRSAGSCRSRWVQKLSKPPDDEATLTTELSTSTDPIPSTSASTFTLDANAFPQADLSTEPTPLPPLTQDKGKGKAVTPPPLPLPDLAVFPTMADLPVLDTAQAMMMLDPALDNLPSLPSGSGAGRTREGSASGTSVVQVTKSLLPRNDTWIDSKGTKKRKAPAQPPIHPIGPIVLPPKPVEAPLPRGERKVKGKPNSRPWEADEEALLLSLVEELGRKWPAVSERLNSSRSAASVSARWHRITAKDVEVEPEAEAEVAVSIPQMPELPPVPEIPELPVWPSPSNPSPAWPSPTPKTIELDPAIENPPPAQEDEEDNDGIIDMTPVKKGKKAAWRTWGPEDDLDLRAHVVKYGKNAWALIGKSLKHPRSAYACSSRWYDHIAKGKASALLADGSALPVDGSTPLPVPEDKTLATQSKRRWKPEEDAELRQLVALHGASRWTEIGQAMSSNRLGTSCRLRYINYIQKNLDGGGSAGLPPLPASTPINDGVDLTVNNEHHVDPNLDPNLRSAIGAVEPSGGENLSVQEISSAIVNSVRAINGHSVGAGEGEEEVEVGGGGDSSDGDIHLQLVGGDDEAVAGGSGEKRRSEDDLPDTLEEEGSPRSSKKVVKKRKVDA